MIIKHQINEYVTKNSNNAKIFYGFQTLQNIYKRIFGFELIYFNVNQDYFDVNREYFDKNKSIHKNTSDNSLIKLLENV